MTAPREESDASLDAIEKAWSSRWEEALALWSRFTKLREPIWCRDAKAERREGLTSSFAMTRFHDHAVVVSLSQVRSHGIEGFPLEVLGHEIGHHVYCPADLNDQARLIARIRRGLPGKERQAGMIANLYADLLINDRLERQAGKSLSLDGVYRRLGGGSTDRMWTFYMRIYEILWSLDRGSLAGGSIDRQIDFDAGLGARLVRVYAKDWERGAGRFAALCFPYLEENDGEGVRIALRGWLDTEGSSEEGIPDGLTEIEEDEEDGAIHPALDPEITGIDDPGDARPLGTGRSRAGDTQPRQRHRDPAEYREILRSVGVKASDDEITIRYYRERAVPHLVPFPVRVLPDATEPMPEGLEVWDVGESIDRLDPIESVLVSETLIPGVTTVQRTYGDAPSGSPEKQPVDLYLGVDCSGSMSNPAVQVSFPVLAGTVLALSALRAGSRVKVVLSGEPGSYTSTAGFGRNEREILGVLTGYLGTGYAFGIHRLRETFEKREADAKPNARPAHILVVTDNDIFQSLGDPGAGGKSGWTVAREAVAAAGGGGTYVLHMPPDWNAAETARMRKEGWDVAFVQEWEDVLAFARDFSRRHYAREAAEA